jgi:hypothetical protein
MKILNAYAYNINLKVLIKPKHFYTMFNSSDLEFDASFCQDMNQQKYREETFDYFGSNESNNQN